VSAKDKATGKAQSIVIKASSGLSDEEIQAMVKDAEANAEEDKKFKEVVELRNQADGLIHNCEKSLKDLADELSADEKSGIEKAIAELKEATAGGDKAQIEDKLKILSEASSKMAERIYAKKGAEGAAGAEAGHAAGGHEQASAETNKPGDESVVDAEFEEVKDDKEGKK
jgi:molecular chaperone DnaK